MGYVAYNNVGGPDAILEKIMEFLESKGWSILNRCAPDLDLDNMGTYDGKVLAATINDAGSGEDLFLVMRSANGRHIFPYQKNYTPGAVNSFCYGIGLTSCTAYTPNPSSGYWYDQINPPLNTKQQVIGVGIPVKQNQNLNLYLNYVTEPCICFIATVELEAGVYQHLAIASCYKVGSWSGGTILSGSRGSYDMFSYSNDVDIIANQSGHLFGTREYPNTLIRIDVDAAPLRSNPVLWAACGPKTFTGKAGLTMRIDKAYITKFPAVPHYGYIQSQNMNDYGRNVNTLNCISVNLPIMLYVLRDPDTKDEYSPIGYVPGTYAVSLRNMAPASVYNLGYPNSGIMHQVFPEVQRKNNHGYDGFSIAQEEE